MGSIRGALQQAEIDFKRGLYEIIPVELHEMPGFWMRRVCRYTRGWGRMDAEIGMGELMRNTPVNIFDHWGKSTVAKDLGGQVCFATEPYLDSDDANVWSVCNVIADALGLDFQIYDEDYSWWYPGNSIRIEFFECICGVPLCEGSLTEAEHRAMCKEIRG